MNTHDSQYFFIQKPAGIDNLPSLSPDKNTVDRRYRHERQSAGSAPLFFHNAAKEYNKKNRIASIKTPPDMLFEGSNFLVPTVTREALLKFDIPHLHMHPAVYIHDDGKWYEDYWYLAFSERFDCWDRSSSTYDQSTPPVHLGGAEFEQVFTYSLDSKLMDETQLEQRLLFQMGGVLDAAIVCHQSLSRLFRDGGDNGAALTGISDY